MKNRINPETGKRYYTKKAEKIEPFKIPLAQYERVRMYAPGNGSLDFVEIDGKNHAVHSLITWDMAQRKLQESGYKDFKIALRVKDKPEHGCIAIPIVMELENRLIFDGRAFENRNGNFYVLDLQDNGWHLTRHISTLACLKFYLENKDYYYKEGK